MKNCYCDSEKSFQDCCEPLLQGQEEAATAVALMRSRYTAFKLKNLEYILATTDPQAVAEINHQANQEWSENSEFTKLIVISASEEKIKATVEFKAYYQTRDGAEHIHHEISKFRKHSGVWYFRDGKVVASTK
jgi:SEC-C motif-containing protein